MAHEQQQLLREIDKPIKERAFNPATFSSMTRAEAMRAFAFNAISPPTWTKQRKQQARERMSKLMDDAGSLSTQENLWLLLAFTSMIGTETTPELSPGAAGGGRGFKKWPIGCVGRSQNGE